MPHDVDLSYTRCYADQRRYGHRVHAVDCRFRGSHSRLEYLSALTVKDICELGWKAYRLLCQLIMIHFDLNLFLLDLNFAWVNPNSKAQKLSVPGTLEISLDDINQGRKINAVSMSV